MTATVAVVADPARAGSDLLADAVARAGLWRALADVCGNGTVEPAALPVLILADMGGFAAGSPAAADPALVEGLVDLLHDRGYTDVALCGTADSADGWAENRDVAVRADLLGYRYVTPQGRAYDVVDLAEDLIDAPFPSGGVLRGSPLARRWLDAGFRIVVAGARTDERETYALCLDALLGALPLADKDHYYRRRMDAGDAVCDLLRATPVHFAVIDAVTAAHGSGGARAPQPIAAGCVIASTSAPLADYAGALKMGLDPHGSPLADRVFAGIGLPEPYTVDGSLAPWPGWRNVPPALTAAARARAALPVGDRLVAPWLQTLDTGLFPLKNVVDARVNPHVSRFFAGTDDDPLALSLLVLANAAISAAGQWLDGWRVLFDKDAIRRRVVPLGFDPAVYRAADYAAIRPELDRLAALLDGVAPAAEDLTWREVDGATVFSYARDLPIPFDLFVARVDVARTIQFMNDYVGGVVVPTARDRQGRVLRQVERNLYLPQPNDLVLYQGKPIDVGKIEICDYGADRHRMYWKTIASANGSAVHDDGVVTFTRSARGTAVRIAGRQLFTLPPFWQAVNLDLAPALKAALVTHAYKTFFDRTLANFEALVEGRAVHIGRDWHEPAHPRDTEALPAEAIERLAVALGEKLEGVLARRGGLAMPGGAGEPDRIDDDGFRHFVGPAGANAEADTAGAAAQWQAAVAAFGAFISDLAAAVARDGIAAPARLAEALT
ncbi:MAG: DUF362 domain-containing protein [Alphaproteobacteria bacterium]